MKIWWITDSKTSCSLFGILYLGNEGTVRLVEQLCKPYERSNRKITFNNYFTSYEFAASLLSKGLTCVGTLWGNKRCIPTYTFCHIETERLEVMYLVSVKP